MNSYIRFDADGEVKSTKQEKKKKKKNKKKKTKKKNGKEGGKKVRLPNWTKAVLVTCRREDLGLSAL